MNSKLKLILLSLTFWEQSVLNYPRDWDVAFNVSFSIILRLNIFCRFSRIGQICDFEYFLENHFEWNRVKMESKISEAGDSKVQSQADLTKMSDDALQKWIESPDYNPFKVNYF